MPHVSAVVLAIKLADRGEALEDWVLEVQGEGRDQHAEPAARALRPARRKRGGWSAAVSARSESGPRKRATSRHPLCAHRRVVHGVRAFWKGVSSSACLAPNQSVVAVAAQTQSPLRCVSRPQTLPLAMPTRESGTASALGPSLRTHALICSSTPPLFLHILAARWPA